MTIRPDNGSLSDGLPDILNPGLAVVLNGEAVGTEAPGAESIMVSGASKNSCCQ